MLEESALFTAIGSIFKDVPPQVMFEIARKGLDAYVKNRFTTVQEERADQGTTEMWQVLAKQNQLPIDVVSYPDITTSQEYMLKQGSSRQYDRSSLPYRWR